MAKKTIVIGTRSSPLALAQTRIVMLRLQSLHPGMVFNVVKIKTKGDRIPTAAQLRKSGKGLFTKELERALLKGKIRMAVHSLKDMPSELPEGLCLGAVLERDDPRDVYVSRERIPIDKLQPKSKIGTSSLRRQTQLQKLYPNVQPVDIKGNLDTRIRKITGHKPKIRGIVVSGAGMARLYPQNNLFAQPLDGMIPAAGQGVIGIEICDDDEAIREMLAPLDHAATRACTVAERELLRRLEGGCQIPLGVHAVLVEDTLIRMVAILASKEGGRLIREEAMGSIEDPASLAQALEIKMRSRGATEVLAEYIGRPRALARR